MDDIIAVRLGKQRFRSVQRQGRSPPSRSVSPYRLLPEVFSSKARHRSNRRTPTLRLTKLFPPTSKLDSSQSSHWKGSLSTTISTISEQSKRSIESTLRNPRYTLEEIEEINVISTPSTVRGEELVPAGVLDVSLSRYYKGEVDPREVLGKSERWGEGQRRPERTETPKKSERVHRPVSGLMQRVSRLPQIQVTKKVYHFTKTHPPPPLL